MEVLKKDFAKALADFDETVKLDPMSSPAFNNRAMLLATCPDAKYRDGKKAVESAKRALALDPKHPFHINVLAAAYAESGDFVEAIRWQEKALADPQFTNDKNARRRLELYRDKKPYRQD